MTPRFLHNSVEVTAGQALDVWLASDIAELYGEVWEQMHLFADATSGYKLSGIEALKEAGIEIQFGEKK